MKSGYRFKDLILVGNEFVAQTDNKLLISIDFSLKNFEVVRADVKGIYRFGEFYCIRTVANDIFINGKHRVQHSIKTPFIVHFDSPNIIIQDSSQTGRNIDLL